MIKEMFLSKEEKERRVIDLYSQGKTFREITEEVKVSPNFISAVIKKKEEEKDNSMVTNNQLQYSSLSSKAYELFSKGKHPVEVAIALNLIEPEVTKLYREYWKLKQLHILNTIYKETNGRLGTFLKIYRLVDKRVMNNEEVLNAIDIAIYKLPYMESLYKQAKDEVDKMERTRQQLENYLHN